MLQTPPQITRDLSKRGGRSQACAERSLAALQGEGVYSCNLFG